MPPPATTTLDATPQAPGSTARPVRGRRRPGVLTVLAAAAAAVFVLVGIGTPLLGLRSFSAVDLLRSYEPWKSDVPTGTQPRNPAVSDTVDVVLPSRQLFADELAGGNLATWNPLASGGSPLGSAPGMAFYSPLNLPYLVLPPWLAPAFAKLLELLVTLGGTVLFARRIGLGRPAALLGGLLFASSGFLVSWTNWPQAQVGALIPALFWAVERFAQLRTVRSAVPIAAVVALLLLGAFPAVAGYALYAAAPYLLLRLVQLTGRRPWALLRGAATAGGALALGVGAVAVLVLPFLAQLRELDYLTERAQTPSVHLPPLMLATVAVWRAFGSVTGGEGYWGPINQVEGLSFLGAGALVLVGFALLRRPAAGVVRGVRAYFVVGTLVAVVLGYAGGPLLRLAQHLPVFSDNPVYRIRSVLGFFLAMLAALGYEALVASPGRRSRFRRAVETAGWLAAAVAALELGRRLLAIGADADRVPYVREQLAWAALPALLVLAAGAVATLARAGRVRPVALAAIPLVVLVESLSLVIPFWPRVPRADYYPVTGTHAFLADHLGHDRYAAEGLTLFPGTNVAYGLRSVTGHTFTSRQWKELLLSADPGAFPTPTFSRLSRPAEPGTVRSPLLDLMAVRSFVFPPDAPVPGTVTPVTAALPAGRLEPGRPVELPIGSGGVRGIGVYVAGRVRPGDRLAALEVALLDGTGRIVATGSRRLYAELPPDGFVVPVAGERLAGTGPLTARLTLRSDVPVPVGVRIDVVRPDPGDGLRLVYAGGTVVYDRTTAQPRFRWADHAVVEPDLTRRLTVLANVREPGRVVLAAPGPLRTDGRPAEVSVLADGTDGSVTRVRAGGAGYLVVADALQDGWQATVDGRPAPLLAADHALVAVPVPAGEHEVRLRYVPPGRRTGALVSLASLVLLAAAVATPALRRRRRRDPA